MRDRRTEGFVGSARPDLEYSRELWRRHGGFVSAGWRILDQRLRHWNVPLLACAICAALAVPSLGQDGDSDASHEESVSLAEAVERIQAAVEDDKSGLYLERLQVQLAEQLADRGALYVAEQRKHVRAEFKLDEVEVLVTSEASPDGRVDLLVEVDDISVDATYAPTASTFHLDGHGNSFGVQKRVVLQALIVRLTAERWDPFQGDSPIEKRLAYRLINLLSEAPVGFPLDARTIEIPEALDGGG